MLSGSLLKLRWLLMVPFLCSIGATSSKAFEASLGIPIPGGIPNSLYVFGGPINGTTLKVQTDSNWEFTGFFGDIGLVSVEKLESVGKSVFGEGDVYMIVGGSIPLALNVGAGLYLVQTDSFALRAQYVSLVTGGGTVLGTDSAGPLIIAWPSILVSYRF